MLFLYNQEWTHEIASFDAGKVPAHRLFGLADVRRRGHDSFACRSPKPLRRILARPFCWRIYQALYAAGKRNADCIVAVHETAALPALLLKRCGLLRAPLIVTNVGLLQPKNCQGKRHALWRTLLPCADAVISYSSVQIEALRNTFKTDPQRLLFIPLGVDTEYFAVTAPGTGDYLLSAGTNEGRDFKTLLAALPPSTRLIVVTDARNADIIARNPRADCRIEVRQNVPIEELRDLYRNARLHIISLYEAQYSSGQTVLLENLSLGKPVIITRVAATQDYIQDGVTAFCVQPGDIEQLRRQILQCLADTEGCSKTGLQGARATRAAFTSEMFADRLLACAVACQQGRQKMPR